LNRFAGQTGTLVIENTGGSDSDWIAWNRLRIVPRSMQERAVEEGSRPRSENNDTGQADFSEARISTDLVWSGADLPGGRAAGLQWLRWGGEAREAMLLLPSMLASLPVTIPENGRLRFALSTGQNRGSGAETNVLFESDGHVEPVFHLVLDDESDHDIWWDADLDVSRFQGQSGTLVFGNESPRTCQPAAWSALELASQAASPHAGGQTAGRPLDDRAVTLMDLLPSARQGFDRREHYPSYEKFDSPTGKPAFLWCDCPARPARMSLVTMAGERLHYDFASLSEHSYLSFGVAHGTGLGDGVEAHVYWEDAQGREEIYQRMVTPQMRDWEDAIIPLPRRAVSGGTLSIEASSGPKRNTVGGWLAWSRLRIITVH
jgi:hypothetical protein